MSKNGLLIGEVAKRTGATRKALRLYEDAGILAAPRRTSSGYRLYGTETLDVLAFVARRSGSGSAWTRSRRLSRFSDPGGYRARTFTIWCYASERTWIEDSQTSGKCENAWT
jgi:MerR family regulatory protein